MLDLSAIISNNRWRDSLVLYSQLADSERKLEIIAFCWSHISRLTGPVLGQHLHSAEARSQYIRAVHALRFLLDAFSGRGEVLTDVQLQLEEMIGNLLRSNDLLLAKQGVEALGLLSGAQAEKLAVKAFQRDVPWLSETAIKACRFVGHLADETLAAKNTSFRSDSFSKWLDIVK